MDSDNPNAARQNILIIDDALENLNLLEATLTKQGYKVRKAINGSMALIGAKAAPPDLILLDIKMPEMDGYEVCRQLKASAQTREIPVIFLSALDEVLDKVKAFSVGGVDYITKPFQPEEVVVRIKTHLALQAAKQEICNLNAELEQRVQQRTLELEIANHELRLEIVERQRAEVALCQSEAQLRQQAMQEKLITAIAQRIRQSLDLQTILDTTVAEVRQFLKVDRVLIYRFESDWGGVCAVESIADPQFSVIGKRIKDHCFSAGYVEQYLHGRVYCVEDIYTANLAPCHIDLLTSLGVRANLLVPIVQNDTLWGMLIANQCTQPRQWDPVEVTLLQQLSTQVAIAIQQSELYRQVQQFNADLERQVYQRTQQLQQLLGFEAALKRITDKVRDSLDESHILQAAVQELAHILQVKCCEASIYNADLTESTITYEQSLLPSCQGMTIQMVNYPDIYQSLLKNCSVQLCYIYPKRFRKTEETLTILACPVFDDQGVIGDLWLFKPAELAFEDLEVRLVQQVANQCAIALRQARLYSAAQAQVETLESLHRLKDDFLSTVSHELRSPVANMKMAIQMLELALTHMQAIPSEKSGSSHSNITQRITQYLQILDNECEREISLVNDLLDLQRLEAGAQPEVTELIDLNHWLPILIESLERRVQLRHQQLHLEMPDTLPLIMSDPNALSRILTELLHNACKYTPPDEKIILAVKTIENQLQLEVTNFGAEIPANELPRIFEKFYRVPNSDRWQQGGTGLGLALVHKLVEHLGGTIAVSSSQGRTTFLITIAIHSAAASECKSIEAEIV
jgi:signal transduction histidine kinase/DNA-binding response OmpR family regulator